MYKNIVFDLGGVVVGFDPRGFLIERFYDEMLESTLYDLTFGTKEWRMLDAGECPREQTNAVLMERAKAAGYGFEVQAVLDDWFSMLHTQHAVVSLMKHLKKSGYHLYYLSNIPFDVLDMMKERNFWPLFEGGVASCEVRTNKPDPAIYQCLMDKYALIPEETIFTDDNPINVKGAYDLGITGIQFQDINSFVKELESCGVTWRRPAPKRPAGAKPAKSSKKKHPHR